ncbi:DUF1488 family protein [Afipia birgiae]|uniref:DUF1488 family protein n=1 Tax=Afipia birgiae TaxID=151414 RepID=UPI0003666EB0|nr:DUF1488 family protein [Afipia birgiae]MBX9820385.1 DUF1488 domain-containing protein [Afipia birgiae]
MAVVRGDFVHFHIRHAGGLQKCHISQAALLVRERLERQDSSPEILLEIFERHRPEIERLAHEMASRGMGIRRGIIITTVQFNS